MPVISKLRNLFGRNVFYVVTPEEMPQVGKMSARQLYATQANLHAVVSFLADSVAQLPLKVYVRDEENSRRRDRDSITAKLLWRPNADQTAYEFINALSIELLLMGCAVMWLLPDPDSESGYQLRIIPREWIVNTERMTNYAPDVLKVHTGAGQFIDIPRTEFVQFRMYSLGIQAAISHRLRHSGRPYASRLRLTASARRFTGRPDGSTHISRARRMFSRGTMRQSANG